MKTTHYTPIPDGAEYYFTTPTGKCDGFQSLKVCERIAAATERDDREHATRSGPLAKILREHFAQEVTA